MSGCPECREGPRRWWLWLLAGVAAIVVAAQLLGCGGKNAVQVGLLAPRPAIQLPHQGSQLALELTATTPDALRVETDGYVTVEVSALRRTLETGFERGFGDAFALVSSGTPGAKLVVEVRRLSFEIERPSEAMSAVDLGEHASVVLTHGGDTHLKAARPPSRPRYAVIQFSAAVHDGTTEMRRITGQVASRDSAGGNARAIGAAITSAIAVMYERIARDLFANHMASRLPG
jgi:hypothetical protein